MLHVHAASKRNMGNTMPLIVWFAYTPNYLPIQVQVLADAAKRCKIFCTFTKRQLMNIYEIGKTVRVRRLAVGLTQQRLAKLAGLSRQTVQQLEAGTIGELSFGRLVNLLRVIGLNFAPPSIQAREKKTVCG